MRKYKNTYEIKDNVGILTIEGNNKKVEVLVDIEDLDKIKPYSWRINEKGYIISQTPSNNKLHIKQKKLRIHNLILDRDTSNSKIVCDHINRNKLDNRKNNLRIVTQGINNINRDIILNAKYYYYRKDRNNYWVPNVGYFKTEEEAKLNVKCPNCGNQ